MNSEFRKVKMNKVKQEKTKTDRQAEIEQFVASVFDERVWQMDVEYQKDMVRLWIGLAFEEGRKLRGKSGRVGEWVINLADTDRWTNARVYDKNYLKRIEKRGD